MADEQLKQQKITKAKMPKAEKSNKNLALAVEKKEELKENRVEETKSEENIQKSDDEDKKREESKKEVKKDKKKEVKIKKSEAIVCGKNLRISHKHSVYVAKFIKNKKISEAIELLERVIKKKIAVPFKGELPHRKGLKLNGKRMMSGKFPEKASKEFIKLLKSLNANANTNGMDLDQTIICEVIANKAPSQYHRFGNTKFKRTHVSIKAKEVQEKTKTEKKNGGKR